MMKKSFKDISWLVSEQEYRADSTLSYSLLARYEKEGFNNLSKLYDKIDTPSLVFGSAVDSIITGGREEFDSRFVVADTTSIPESLSHIIKLLYNKFGNTYQSLDSIPDNDILTIIDNEKWQSKWKNDTRLSKIRSTGEEYYNLLHLSEDKTIISSTTYYDVMKCVQALKTSISTSKYLNNTDNNVEVYYQLKFKDTINGVDYKCMADIIYVDYYNKIIIPIDLKTSSKPEWDFYKSFIEYRYDIQAKLYWRIIHDNIIKDDYFKDFKLEHYRFIVINRVTLIPLVWVYSNSWNMSKSIYGKFNQIELRDPLTIGDELSHYLKSCQKVPDGIDMYNENSIIEKLDNI